MKIYVFVFLIIAAVSFALPNEDERQLNLTYEPKFLKLGGNIEDLEEYNRQRKFTCEYMCALRCLFTGYQGSFCSKEGICFCDEFEKDSLLKMKIYVFALLVVAAIAFALPIEDEVPLESLLANENESLNLAPVEESAHSRQRRVTCDLLSGLGWSHSICAAHCIAKGKKGGSCSSSGVCNCRKK